MQRGKCTRKPKRLRAGREERGGGVIYMIPATPPFPEIFLVRGGGSSNDGGGGRGVGLMKMVG